MNNVLKYARAAMQNARLFAAAAAVALSGGVATGVEASMVSTHGGSTVTSPWTGESKSNSGGAPAVTPGDTFSFDISGFNSGGTVGYLLTPDETSTFGTTQTYTAAGINGQDITIASSESIDPVGGTTTDTFTVTTPTNFLTTTKVSGTTITQLQFDLGNANSGSNTVDYVLPVTGNTEAGYMLYTASNTQFALSPLATLTNGGLSVALVEGVSYGTSAISGLAVHNFTMSITYNTVPTPEPTSIALLAPVAIGALRRRRKI